jgi:hypothetical protein
MNLANREFLQLARRPSIIDSLCMHFGGKQGTVLSLDYKHWVSRTRARRCDPTDERRFCTIEEKDHEDIARKTHERGHTEIYEIEPSRGYS